MPQHEFIILSDTLNDRIEQRLLQVPQSATFADFKVMVTDGFFLRWLTKTDRGKKYEQNLRQEDELYPYAEDYETPESGDPYFEHLKVWNDALHPIHGEFPEKKRISQEKWLKIEQAYYRDLTVGSDETRKTGRTIAQFREALGRKQTYDSPGAGWYSLTMKNELVGGGSHESNKERWKAVDDEQDWRALKETLLHSTGLIAKMRHQSVEDQERFLLRRAQMEEAVRSAGAWIPATEQDIAQYYVPN